MWCLQGRSKKHGKVVRGQGPRRLAHLLGYALGHLLGYALGHLLGYALGQYLGRMAMVYGCLRHRHICRLLLVLRGRCLVGHWWMWLPIGRCYTEARSTILVRHRLLVLIPGWLGLVLGLVITRGTRLPLDPLAGRNRMGF